MPMLMFWSVPRGRSTAFYRMMTERGDVTCFFEPFSHAEVFGQVDIGGRSLATVPEVLAELRSLATTQTVFIKDTTDRRHPAIMADQRFWAQDAQHTFLIRHPSARAAYELYAKVSRLTGRDPLVIDAGDLMRRPAQTVEAYCARAGLKFRPDALSWQPSDRPEWQSGFSHWFTGVVASSGFADVPSRRRPAVDQHPLLATYLAYHMPFYAELYQRRLVV
jgi:hypothetical protein